MKSISTYYNHQSHSWRLTNGHRHIVCMASRARVEACRQLLKIETEGSFISLASGQISAQALQDDASLSRSEARTVKSLVAGATRWKRRLDAVISVISSRSTTQMDPDVLTVLRLGMFELTMEEAPSHIVNDLVEVSKSICQTRGTTGLINWTLRECVRRQESNALPTFDLIPLELTGRDLMRALGIKHSFPNWMISRFLSQFGREGAEAFMEASNSIPLYHVRTSHQKGISPAKLVDMIETNLDGEAAISTLLPNDFVVIRSGLQAVLASGLMESGSISVQDVSCGLVVQLLDPQPGDQILDCCSAPGGKAIFAAAKMKGEGRIKALDISSSKLRALETASKRMGVRDMIELQASALQSFESDAIYDRVMVDAPCSGTGVLAKRADLRWRRTPEQMQELISLQDDLLAHAARLVKPGGILVYSTCSIDREENEDRISHFLSKQGRDFLVDSDAAVSLLPSDVATPEGYLKTLPHLHLGADGAFACRLRKVK